MRTPVKNNTSEKLKSTRSVTIKDLSADLGLSITTISRALNGYSDVGEKTRKRVEDAAQKHGYRPNRNAQRLVTQRTHNIAWVQPDNEHKFLDPHFVEVMAGVLRGARLNQYDIVMTSATVADELATYDRYVRDNSVDGFIVDLPRKFDSRVDFLLEAQRPFIVHGREERCDDYCWVDIDNFQNFYDLTRLMISAGHQHIAFVNGDESYSFAIDRRRGFEAAIDDMGADRSKFEVFNTTHPMGEAGFRLTELALADEKVTAILYSSALMAVEGHSAIVRAGRTAGSDLAVGSMDDQLHYLDLSPFAGRFTFVRSSLSKAGLAIITQLIDKCERKGPPTGTLIPSVFDFASGIDGSVLDKPGRI